MQTYQKQRGVVKKFQAELHLTQADFHVLASSGSKHMFNAFLEYYLCNIIIKIKNPRIIIYSQLIF